MRCVGRWVLGVATALVMSLLAVQMALAQTGSTIAPPSYTVIDANGMDLASLNLSSTTRAISVGSADKGLSFSMTFDQSAGQSYVANGYNGFHAYDGGRWRMSLEGQVILNPDGTLSLSFGDKSAIFDYTGVGYVSRHRDGSTLTRSGYDYIYTGADGTVAVFSYTGSFGGEDADLISVTKPDGEVLTYTYTSFTLAGAAATGWGPCQCDRLQAISSSLGYQVHLTYDTNFPAAVSSVTAFNSAVDYCDPTANTCTFSQPWPTLTISTQNAGSYREWVQIVTDSLGQQAAYWVTWSGLAQLLRPSQQPVGTPVITLGLVLGQSQGGISTTTSTLTDGPRTWKYTEQGRFQTTVTDPANHTRTLTFNISSPALSMVNWGTVSTDTDENGHTTHYGYDTYGDITDITHPEGDVDHYDYDAYGNILDLIKYPKTSVGGAPFTVASATFNNCANPITCAKPDTTTDGNGNVTHYTYDGTHGGVLTATGPSVNGVQAQTRYSYSLIPTYAKNSSGTLVQIGSVWRLTRTSSCMTSASCTGTADEKVTTISYAGATDAQPTAVTVAAGDGSASATTHIGYDGVGNVASITNPLNVTTNYVYDVMRQKTYEVGPDINGDGNRLTTYTHYTRDGLVDQVQVGLSPGGNTAAFSAQQTLTSTYDAQNFKLQDLVTASGLQTLTQYSYDTVGRLYCTAQRMNPAAFGGQSNACQQGTPAPDGTEDRITANTYDPAGRLTKVEHGIGSVNSYQVYDQPGYGDDGEKTSDTDANGNVTGYSYDGFNRLTTIFYPNASGGGSNAGDYEQLSYDNASNIVLERRRDGTTVALYYDALNRPISDLNGSSFTYDNMGHLRTATLAGVTVSMNWDALDRQVNEMGPLGTIGYGYDLSGALTRVTWPDGLYAVYQRNAAGSVTSILENGATTLATYGYDDLGRRTAINRGNGVSTGFAYDDLSRLRQLSHTLPEGGYNQTLNFSRNTGGQITVRTASNTAYDWAGATSATRTYNPNGLNQLTTSGPYSLGYGDGRGNLTSDQIHTYGYSISNQLTGYAAGGVTAALTYDALGRLAQTSGSAAATTRFAYAGDQLIAEYDGSGNLLRRYVPGADAAVDPIVWYEGADTSDRRWLIADERGSVMAETNASGAVIGAPNTYDEYGYPGGANQGRFQYTGQLWIPEVGLYHYKARAYSPTQGRFMQTDPAGYADDLNWYAYAGNDPINGIDPSGMAVVVSCNDGDTCTVDGSGTAQNGDTFNTDDSNEVTVLGHRNPQPTTGSIIFIQVGGSNNTPIQLQPQNSRTSCSSSGAPYMAGAPGGPVAIPAMAPGGIVRFGSVGGNAALGFGVAGAVGSYSYSGADGYNYTGSFVTVGMAVGEGASGGRSLFGRSSSLGAFFGNSASATFTAGAFGASGSVNESGFSTSTTVGLGEFAGGESTYTIPIGAPKRVSQWCH